MLRIRQPDWEENKIKYQQNIEAFIERLIAENQSIFVNETTTKANLKNEISIKSLYASIINPSTDVQIKISKIEQNNVRELPWHEAAANSGAEKFISAIIILGSLIHYIRHVDTNISSSRYGKESAVLPMDNPFAQIQSEHLLTPMFEFARKSNIQLICFTAMKDPAIYNCFDNVITGSLRHGIINNIDYLVSHRTQKTATVTDIFDSTRIEVKDITQESELKSLFD